MRADASPAERRVQAVLDLVDRFGVECHAIGWHRARYGDAVPPELRQARDGVLALIEARLREMGGARDGG
jgi:hypothetical protein